MRRTDAAGRVIEYTYDAAGNLTSRVTASQSLVYTYDERNRLTSVTQTVAGGTPRTTTYTYDAVGNRASMTGGDGTQTVYTYDRRNRLTQLVQRSAAAALLFAASYQVDATGLRTGAQESDAGGVVRTLAWTYDALKRLTGESIDHRDDTRDRTSTWTYDRVGNRLTQVQTVGTGALAQTTTTTSTYDANDRLLTQTAQTGTSPAQVTTTTYDAQGNTLTRSGPDGLVEYTWNDTNRLVEQRTASGRTTYRYDADGLRIGQTHFPTTGTPTRTDYLVDPSFAYANVIERFEGEVAAGAPKLAQVYAFGEGIVGQTTCTPTAGSGVHDCPGVQERFVHADGFGSTRFLTDAAGAVTDRVDYDAWGNEIGREGSTAVEHLYRGEQFDPNLGFYYLRTRWMDPANGRFDAVDPFAGLAYEPQSLHKYLYVHGDPINLIDPSGLSPLVELMIGVDFQNAIRVSSGQTARWAFKKVLFGNPPRDFGLVGEWVIDYIIQSATGSLLEHGGSRAQPSLGTSAHLDLEERIEDDFKRFKRRAERKGFILTDVEVKSEVFRLRDGTPAPRRGAGTVGIDVVVYYKGKPMLAFDLKTGAGYRPAAVASRVKAFGTNIIQITVKPLPR